MYTPKIWWLLTVSLTFTRQDVWCLPCWGWSNLWWFSVTKEKQCIYCWAHKYMLKKKKNPLGHKKKAILPRPAPTCTSHIRPLFCFIFTYHTYPCCQRYTQRDFTSEHLLNILKFLNIWVNFQTMLNNSPGAVWSCPTVQTVEHRGLPQLLPTRNEQNKAPVAV